MCFYFQLYSKVARIILYNTCTHKWLNDCWTQVIHTYTGHDHPVHLLLPFADHLISVDEGNHVKVWDIKSEGRFG